MLKMDGIRVKTQQLLDKLQNKYGMTPTNSPRLPSGTSDGGLPFRFKNCEDAGGGGEEVNKPAIHAWYLVDPKQKKLRLPRTMLFLGRDECDIIIQSGTVDKRHAVITFDLYLSRFKVKDLSTTNGTYVNESRIPEQEYVTLNHMDTVRLGYDSKVYHMEQGEPCTGDSPSPPGTTCIPPQHPSSLQHQATCSAAPVSSLSSSSYLMGAGESPSTTKGGSSSALEAAALPPPPPLWSSRHSHDRDPQHMMIMAECQGCIAEQRIEHTCTHAPNPTTTTTAPPHHHHHHDNSSHSPRFVEVQRKSNNTQSSHTEKPVGLGQGNCGFFPAAEKEEELDPTEADADDPLEAALPEETVRLGRNTWPRKKLRQARRAATDLFGDDCDGMVDDEEIAVESGSNYFVSVDDSAVCESASAGVRGSGRMVVEYSLSRTGSVHRIPRNSKNVPLPPELETVKKGSSLYGQPSWWGEDTDNGDKEGAEASQPKGEAKSPRPSSLVVQGHAADAGGPQPHPPPQKQKKKTQHPKDAKPVYMEIPHHSAATPERDKPPLQQQRDKCTPARSISSLSKDSLVVSPDSARGRSVDKESDSGGKAGTGSGSGGEGAAGNPALSFTVEFGDEKAKKPKLKSGASLSQFVPPKLRSSLSSHCRSEKAASSSRDGSCKNSEERELSSPVAIVKQRKQEEHTPSGGAGEAPSKGKSARRSSGQGTGVGSLRSSDFSSETTPPGSAQSRRETERRPSKEAEKEMDKKPPKPQEPRKTTSRPPTSKGSKAAKAQPSAAAIAASVQAAQYSDPTAYLIERMFAGATDSPRSESSEPERSDSPAAPEHAMYKEARQYDRASQRGSATYRASSNSSSKPTPQQKQKSLSRSPAASNGKSPAGPKSSPKSPASPKTPKTTAAAATKPLEKQPSLLKEKSAESDRPRATASATAVTAAACAPQALPKAPSPITAGGDQEDKVSEAGTYTIEAEEDGEEELMARQQIDEIYGVTDVNSFSFERPIIASRENVQGSQEDEEEKTLHEDLEEASVKTGCHTPCDDDETEKIFDDDIEEDENGDLEEEAPVEEEGVMSRSIGDEEVPSWVSQLNSLTAGIRQSPAKDAMAKGTEDASKKSSQGLSRKRPGTGRKLPSIPTADQSPVSSEHSAHHNSPDSPANAQNGARSSSLVENGHDRSTDDSPSRNVGFSPVVSASGAVSGKSRLEGSPCGSEGSGTNNISSVAIPKGSLMCSRGSTDTELLLRDTETVMAAMEARMGFNQEDRRNREDDGESDSDLTSTVAMVNGDEDFIKPTKYHSPRDTMTGKVSKNKDNSNIRIAASSRKTMARSFSEQKPPVKSERSPRSTAGVSVVSDVLSRSNSLDQSFQSDASDGGSSDRTDTTFSRSGSRGKGTITMAKPNRAFALRRALADGSETADTARSHGSAPSTAASASSRRSSSIHGTPRTSYSDRTGTEASLGAQIVKKAREKTGTPKGRESSITRQDGVRRNSLRGADRRSSASSTASSTVSSAKKERDIRTLKSQLRSTPGNRDLAITGVGSSRSQSQPGSRSNSPKAAERMAWKRRKEYDPRKSVAEARASKAKEPRPKPKVQATSLYKQRMTRSASFTNSAELSGRARHDTYNVESISSAEDLSSAATVSEPYGETGFRRAFIPFHNPRRSDRLIHSADEDEAGPFPVSQSYDSLIVSSIYQLTLKLKTTMDKTLVKLREQDRASITPSPIDDFLGHTTRNEIPAWKSANQELAGVLKNLRMLERQFQSMDRALFPDEDTDTDVSGMSSTEKHKYYQEIERIRSELAGFHPIDSPHSQSVDPGSPEMAELSKNVQ